jgi:acyl-coenzyme A thioesterase PaaI-like protein
MTSEDTIDQGGRARADDSPAALFLRDGDTFVPTRLAQGPWGSSISGHAVGGMLGRTLEREAGDAELQPARLTVDLLRPVALAPLQVQTNLVRDGRRLRLADATITQNGTVVARASGLFLRRGEQPTDQVFTTPVTMPAKPTEPDVLGDDLPMFLWAFGKDPVHGSPGIGITEWQHSGPKYVWLRETKPLIEGEALTPFTRAAMAGDVASSLSHWSTGGLTWINADYTLTLSRLPDGPYLGLAALTHYSDAGVATGTATIVDHRGPIGTGTATALVNPGFRPPFLD